MKSKPELETRLAQIDDRLAEMRKSPDSSAPHLEELQRLQEEADAVARELFADLEPWDHIGIARHDRRPYSLDYIELLFTDFVELHGDRRHGDDGAIVAGLANFNGEPVAIIGQQKGRTATERKQRNFGMARPEGYRKAMRIMQLAAKRRRPIITFVDTPGYLPGLDQEHYGIIRHGAKVIYAFCEATVPKISILTRKAVGGAYIAMSSRQMRCDVVFAWPTAYIAVMGAEGAVRILRKRDLAVSGDPRALETQFAQEYRDRFFNPYVAANMGQIDEVIEPKETRPRLVRALEVLRTKVKQNPPKKHGLMPL